MNENRLTINLLGNVGIYYDGEDITTKLSSKSVAIIMFLVANYNKKITREKISDLLWAEKYENAGYNLRYNLWNIKKVIPFDMDGRELITSNKEYCQINPDYIFEGDIVNVKKLEEKQISNMNLDELKSMKNEFKGEFLEQIHIKDAEEFYEWILINRIKYQKLYISCLNQMYTLLHGAGRYEDKIDILDEILNYNPYDEESHYNLMIEHMKEGKRHRAISQYKKCDNLLRSELNIGAKPKLKELYMKLINEQSSFDNEGRVHKEILLNQYFNKNIDYLVLSQLIENLAEIERELNLKIMNPNLYYIFSSIVPFIYDEGVEERSSHQINDIKLFIAVREAIEKTSSQIKLKITIYNKEKMDLKSKTFFEYASGSLKGMRDIIQYVK
ncbi:MAG: BTAD domain-containing putative transcriptional regulator [Proteocatella sp.]